MIIFRICRGIVSAFAYSNVLVSRISLARATTCYLLPNCSMIFREWPRTLISKSCESGCVCCVGSKSKKLKKNLLEESERGTGCTDVQTYRPETLEVTTSCVEVLSGEGCTVSVRRNWNSSAGVVAIMRCCFSLFVPKCSIYAQMFGAIGIMDVNCMLPCSLGMRHISN